MGLAALLIPLIPGLIQSIMGLINTIQSHPDTPAAAKIQLAEISVALDETAKKVAAVQV